MLYRTKEKIKRLVFNLYCKDILNTNPITTSKNSSVMLVTLLSHLDVIMYLVSIKSFYFFLNNFQGRITIINDGSLTSYDIYILKKHINGLNIINIDSIDTKECPKGGCWERLIYILNQLNDYYVIQLDADTLFLGEVSEVDKAIKNNCNFILSGVCKPLKILPVTIYNKEIQNNKSKHIQVLAEKKLIYLPNSQSIKYIKGCAAFAGFSRKSVNIKSLIQFSKKMESYLGSKWHKWGSEQVASNYILSNFGQCTTILQYPKYQNFLPDCKYNLANFIHFIGTYRFKKLIYPRLAKKIIKQLK